MCIQTLSLFSACMYKLVHYWLHLFMCLCIKTLASYKGPPCVMCTTLSTATHKRGVGWGENIAVMDLNQNGSVHVYVYVCVCVYVPLTKEEWGGERTLL